MLCLSTEKSCILWYDLYFSNISIMLVSTKIKKTLVLRIVIVILKVQYLSIKRILVLQTGVIIKQETIYINLNTINHFSESIIDNKTNDFISYDNN